MIPFFFSSQELESFVKQALDEDAPYGDITTHTLIPADIQTVGQIQAKEDLVVAGMPLVQKVFGILDASTEVTVHCDDGRQVNAGQVLVTIEGRARPLLTGERVALNFLQHLSGIATITRKFCEAIHGFPTKILDTRKTLPGLRRLEKWAVALGGGYNHRHSLSDGILIKDNHLAVLQAQGLSLADICHRIKKQTPHYLKCCIEVDSLEQIDEALQGEPDVLLLDNMPPAMVREAVQRVKGKALIEVSGGISLKNVQEFAAAGANFISIGSLTHSAPAVDISMEIKG